MLALERSGGRFLGAIVGVYVVFVEECRVRGVPEVDVVTTLTLRRNIKSSLNKSGNRPELPRIQEVTRYFVRL